MFTLRFWTTNHNNTNNIKLRKCTDSKLKNSEYTRRDIQRASDTSYVTISLNPTQINVLNIPLLLHQQKGKLSPLKPCIPSGGALITLCLRHGAFRDWVPKRDLLALWTEQVKTTEFSVSLLNIGENMSLSSQNSFFKKIFTATSYLAPYSSHLHLQPLTSSIDGKPTPAALALQPASAGP